MRFAICGLASSHCPTTNTVIGVFRALASSSNWLTSPTSPEPWNVNATSPLLDGPLRTNAAGPDAGAGSVGLPATVLLMVVVARCESADGLRDLAQAAITAAERPPRMKVRRVG